MLLPVLYEDDDLLAIAKPPGMFVHRSEVDRSATDFVVQHVRDQLGHFVYPVHRLDKATSGIVILARSRKAAAGMGALFSGRSVSKNYFALLRGHCLPAGRIDIALVSERGRNKPHGHPFREPQEAMTVYRRLKTFEIPICSDRYPTTRCCLVDVHPLTGRFHQIRRHFNYVSHPVIGDTSHGDSRQNKFFRDRFQNTRLMLAAVRVEFSHPFTQRRVVIECPPDAAFQELLSRLQEFEIASSVR